MDEPEKKAGGTAATAAPKTGVRRTAFARSLGDAWVETSPGIFRRAGAAEPAEHGLRVVDDPPPEAA